MTKVSGDRDSVFGYAGYLWHAASGLSLAVFRAYDPNLGRWISRDPIGEKGGLNVYAYVGNQPTRFIDPYGLDSYDPGCLHEVLNTAMNAVLSLAAIGSVIAAAYGLVPGMQEVTLAILGTIGVLVAFAGVAYGAATASDSADWILTGIGGVVGVGGALLGLDYGESAAAPLLAKIAFAAAIAGLLAAMAATLKAIPGLIEKCHKCGN